MALPPLTMLLLLGHHTALLASAARQRRTQRSLQGQNESLFTICSGHGHRKSLFDRTCVCDAAWMGSDCGYHAPPMKEVAAACYNPGGDDGKASCQWYFDCLSPRIPACKRHASEYAESYGGKYCSAFAAHSNEFSANGQKWIEEVMLCLQEALATDVLDSDAEYADCEGLRAVAFDSHPRCYLRPDPTNTSVGICSLLKNNVRDVVRIFEITWDALFSKESVKQMVGVAKGCGVALWKSLIKGGLTNDGYDTVADMIE